MEETAPENTCAVWMHVWFIVMLTLQRDLLLSFVLPHTLINRYLKHAMVNHEGPGKLTR